MFDLPALSYPIIILIIEPLTDELFYNLHDCSNRIGLVVRQNCNVVDHRPISPLASMTNGPGSWWL
ncbi:MAG: hypothetical protein OXD38_11700, partial [Aestuariivita sp.]|nr:hypothetical protein [Aestuariivita sp.]